MPCAFVPPKTATVGLLTVAAACAFLFVDPAHVPLVLWDESRVAVNALEMHQQGWQIVTTFGFEADLWNTKPPLAIWLIVLSFKVFGVSDFALRLPSMLASIGTLALVFSFTRRISRSDAMGVLATALVALSVNYFGPNGVKTAEYDSLLCFFTTAYLIMLFEAFARRRPTSGQLLRIALLIAAATMTKGVAGLVPGSGALVYLLLTRRLGRVLRHQGYWMCGVVALLPVVCFAIARESVSPGYLNAAYFNDAGGRFGEALDGHGGSFWYYPSLLFANAVFVGGWATLLVPAVAMVAHGRRRAALVFALVCAVAPLVILGFAATKLVHYSMPVIPWLAIASALAVDTVRRRLAGLTLFCRMPAAAAFMLVAGLTVIPGLRTTLYFRYDYFPSQQFHPLAGYGNLLAELHDRGVRAVTIYEHGIEAGGFSHYAPQFRYYSVLAASRGMNVARLLAFQPVAGASATCDPRALGKLLALGAVRARFSGCAFLLGDGARD